MMDPAIAATGGMEGGGALPISGKRRRFQAAGAAVALRLLQDAARTIALPSGDEPDRYCRLRLCRRVSTRLRRCEPR